jgi:predicted RNA polymerase sigma factor
VTTPDVRRTIEAVRRIESARLIAGLAGIVRDVGIAEEILETSLHEGAEGASGGGIKRDGHLSCR